MSIDSDSNLSAMTTMSAEAGFDGSDIQAPIRISGFLCLILGLASVGSFLAIGMLFIPFFAIAFGLYALRRYSPPKPVGVTAAYLGVLLAVGFGAFGLGVPLFKKHTLGSQAEQFARDYIKLVSMGHDYYALELQKEHFNRFLRSMPLEEHYASNEVSKRALEDFRQDGLRDLLVAAGPDAEWELDRPIRVFHSYGRDNADVVLSNEGPTGARLIRVLLESNVSEAGDLQWHVKVFQQYRERIVAETVM
ncbi:hypothetical protein [Planctomycetes bacterium K23_9]|uniref:Uncharacterized protein n=1 Tax=Stieleria marina TaxID=1930275 RepID=A0A517NNI4_9BACT|nr:hypothetical protein K239x_06040 [Planctomycetes bacterium K23_9]